MYKGALLNYAKSKCTLTIYITKKCMKRACDREYQPGKRAQGGLTMNFSGADQSA